MIHQGYTDFRDEKGMSKKEFTNILMQFSTEMGMRQGAPVTEEAPLAANLDSISYAIGADFSDRMKASGVEINTDAFHQGCKDMFAEDGPKIDLPARQGLIQEFSKIMQEKQAAKMEADGAVNIEKGEAFLAENATKEGVQITDTGLQYKVITAGAGASPAATDIVTVHYEGRLLDGTVFDSSYERGEPIEFALNRVIPGWTEGLQLMNAGAKYQLYIPSGLAYGKRGSPPNIGSNETLIFDVELLSFKPAPPPPAPAQ
jgi:FKBP-type peptidyl-prolyl cis-trans isomerase